MQLLIVEDDRQLREALTDLLRQSGFEVDAFGDGDAAFNALLSHDYDIAVIDLGLPGMDGLTLVRNLRRQQRGLPILVVTARDALEDRVSGLDAGADDYLVKPFALQELEARVRALLRRQRADRNAQIRIGALALTPGQPRIMLGGVPVDLRASEFALLEALATRVPELWRAAERPRRPDHLPRQASHHRNQRPRLRLRGPVFLNHVLRGRTAQGSGR